MIDIQKAVDIRNIQLDAFVGKYTLMKPSSLSMPSTYPLAPKVSSHLFLT